MHTTLKTLTKTTRTIPGQRGFSIVEAIIILVVLAGLCLVGYGVFLRDKGDDVQKDTASVTQQPAAKEAGSDSNVTWENTGEGGWIALNGTPPACPDPFMINTPSDISKATSVLYPGQERQGGTFTGAGGSYKPHGAFRFDGLKNNEVDVESPIDGYVYRGSQYLVEGEMQYTFDLIHPCGFMVRLGHLRALSDTFQGYADKFPAAQEGDSGR
ncbi:MAG: hypothetical protein AAB834_06730, partial [Patescibacteria group bacterium]